MVAGEPTLSLNVAHVPAGRHTPMKPLFGGRYGTKHIGYECQHCKGLFTASGTQSGGGLEPSIAHLQRSAAALNNGVIQLG